MDDHLFINLRHRVPCSWQWGKWRLATFCIFLPLASGSRSLYALTVIWATEDEDVLGVRRLLEQRGVWTCDVISGTFLCLWQMTVFSPLSWPQHLLLQIHPPSLLCLGLTSWQLSHSRCFTDEKQYPTPTHHSSSFSLFLAKSIAL